ncbi:MAG TPA: sigma 54-interacting transcriptional regulator [Polyangiaceae bacterium]|nr:sigma 54-interacting transcriptional regulator [Polyangiaceae bacterium]
MTFELPARYESQHRLGKGGGGEVWAVRDRHTGVCAALKMLAADATESEMSALVREAVTLSGLEGLGVPRVLRFGRLPGDGRPFMVRELVEGRSLQELIDERVDAARCLSALASAAEQVTLLHRAGLLHGDIKPANVIVEAGGRATLVDLGLSAPWREGGTAAQGLTPKYAAPELLRGKPLTVRAEVYALGIALADIVHSGDVAVAMRTELDTVAARATRTEPGDRFPSADEFASALCRAANVVSGSPAPAVAEVWPIVGIEATASRLVQTVQELPEGGALAIRGASGSGRSVLVRRLAWSLGVEGTPLAWIDETLVGNSAGGHAELSEHRSLRGVTILVDDLERLSPVLAVELAEAQRKGARLVLVGSGRLTAGAASFDVPALGAHAATELVHRAVPGLTERLVKRVVELCGGRPGELRRFVRKLAEQAIASEQDLEDLLGGIESPRSLLPADPLERALSLLDRGRFTEARDALALVGPGRELLASIAGARLELGLGEAKAALERLESTTSLAGAEPGSLLGKTWRMYVARARLGAGEYASALELLEPLTNEPGALGAEALAYRGLALAYSGDEKQARAVLEDAVERATAAGSRRIEAIAASCLGLTVQRGPDTEGARKAYERAIAAAEDAGDAGVLATTFLNLATLLGISGDIAGAIERYEAAIDMGRRSGRRATVRHALLNLANSELYLGRFARARSSIDTLAAQREQLPPVSRAQLLGLTAELAGRSGQFDAAAHAYAECAAAFHELGLGMDAAEARLEGVLVAARQERPDATGLAASIALAEADLAGTSAHRPTLSLARGIVAWIAGDEKGARRELEQSLKLAREANQREWIWRALEARSEIEEDAGQPISARRDREDALAVLEEIAARLPRDLREVFWNEPRRKRLRGTLAPTLATATTQHADDMLPPFRFDVKSSTSSSIAAMTSTPLERRLARILEINAELLGEVNLELLAARVTDHAVDMLQAERGFVLLRDATGKLSVHTSRGRLGDSPTAEFSRSIAEQVVRTGEPVAAVNAKGDVRLRSFTSVHQLALESVACVPIQSRAGDAIGALYVETRLRSGASFERELPTLRAFADQVAIALETASLIRENVERAAALADANEKLERAQSELKELLGDRTAQLRRTRAKLRDARDTLYGHFGYQGLVGTSAAMRKVYALIDRVKSTDIPVLITGESGTGKEVAARAIHRASARTDRPFHGLNCAAVPEHLLESELFGHVRGAFTGADRERKGLFREADTGTLLLDEIGEMPQKMQTGLLRVLQERKVRPVGGANEQEVDVRLIFATHRDLAAMVKEGRFREDLFYRIHVVEVHLPPLRERAEDVAPLVDHFLGIFAARYKREKRSVSREALRRLTQYAWPGNVRQLEHVLLNAWVLSDEPVLGPEDLDIPDGRSFAPPPAEYEDDEEDEDEEDDDEAESAPRERAADPRVQAPRSAPKETLSRHRRDERERIISALQACNWNRVQAAKLSGIPRRTFYRRLREYGIQ